MKNHTNFVGYFLISEPYILDSVFGKPADKTVVLIVDQNDDEIIGLRLDVPSKKKFNMELYSFNPKFFSGGDFEPNYVTTLERSTYSEGREIIPGIYLSRNQSLDTLISFSNVGLIQKEDVIFFHGYCRWTILEFYEDLAAKHHWYLAPALPELIFKKNEKSLWQTLRRDTLGLDFNFYFPPTLS